MDVAAADRFRYSSHDTAGFPDDFVASLSCSAFGAFFVVVAQIMSADITLSNHVTSS